MRTSLFRYAGSFFFNSMVRFFLRTRVHDNLSGFIGIRRKLYDQLFHDEIFYGYGDYAIRLIYNARMFKPAIIEIPVIYEFRASGTSKTNLFKCLFSYTGCVLSTLMHFKRRN
jgi:dolichol-phosphate mannosyltransferase